MELVAGSGEVIAIWTVKKKRSNDIIGKVFVSVQLMKNVHTKYHFLFTSYKAQRI